MVKVLKEIEDRKVNQTLSTRQRERFKDPTRLPILWDVLLYQMVCTMAWLGYDISCYASFPHPQHLIFRRI